MWGTAGTVGILVSSERATMFLTPDENYFKISSGEIEATSALRI